MKKVILALAIVSVTFAACNEGEKKVETPKTDSVVIETPAVVVPDSITVPVADSIKK